MLATAAKVTISSAALLVACVSFVPDANAKTVRCSASEMSIPDDRGGGRKLCLKKSEWRKAKRICDALAVKSGKKSNPMDCICQDGNKAGACGN